MKFKLVKAEKYPKLIKDGNKYIVLYAEGTKGKEFDTKEEAEKYKKSIKSRNLTRSERHNRNMQRIFDHSRQLENEQAEFLKSKGLSEEEVAHLKRNTGLGKNSLDEKIIELGLHKEFWDSRKNASKIIKSGESYGWIVNPEDAWDKLQLWIDAVGAEAALDDIAKAMGTEELSSCLAFIFRNNDFKEGCSDFESEDDGE